MDTIDKSSDYDVSDKENELPVTPMESPDNTLVIAIKVIKDDQQVPESVVKTDGFQKKSNQNKKPPTGELPDFTNRNYRNNKGNHHYQKKPRLLDVRPLGISITPKHRRKKHPGLRQVLSPKALYPSAPPGYKVKIKTRQSICLTIFSMPVKILSHFHKKSHVSYKIMEM